MAPVRKWIRFICVWVSVLVSALLFAFLLAPSSGAATYGTVDASLPLALNHTQSLHFPSKAILMVDHESEVKRCRSIKDAAKLHNSKDRSLPNPLATADRYLEAEVFADINTFLNALPDGEKYVLLVIADSFYRDMTINWVCVLFRTSPSLLKHVLVLSMDEKLHTYMLSKGISSVLTQHRDLLNMTVVNCGYKKFGHVWMTRVLMIHYFLKQGFDVFVMDTDAFPIQDPMNMVNEIVHAEGVDAIFGRGTFPPVVNRLWGFTLCFGTAYFRSTPGSMHLLEAMGRLDPLHNDDQVRLNMAVKAVTGVDWRDRSTYGVTVGSSRSSSLQFKVSVLPYSVVCRSTCSKLLSSTTADQRKDLHIVHSLIAKGTNKKSRLAHLGFWALDEEKMEEVDSQTAEMWLTGVCTREYQGLRV